MTDFEFLSRNAVPGHPREIQKFSCHTKEARRKTGAEVHKHLLEMPCRLTKEHRTASSPAITPNLDRLELQRIAICEEAGLSRERLRALESELVADVNKLGIKPAELKISLDVSATSPVLTVWKTNSQASKPHRLKRFKMQVDRLLLSS